MWQADGYTFLHSGRPLCEEGSAVRNEGVGLELDERATSASKEAGEVWNAVSSRIVTARLKASSVGQRRLRGSRETRNTYISVISVYMCLLPRYLLVLHRSSGKIFKIQWRRFQRQMCLLFLKISMLELAVVQQRMTGGQCIYMEGMVLVLVRLGMKFLEFCAVNQFTTMNTWFNEKDIHLAMWKHPAMKQSHMIDYVVMQAEQRVSCTDVQVMRGANCWTDHYMVRARVRIELPCQQKKRPSALPFAVHTLCSVEKRCTYQQNLDQQLYDMNSHTTQIDRQNTMEPMKRCIGSAAEVVGRGRKKQPD